MKKVLTGGYATVATSSWHPIDTWASGTDYFQNGSTYGAHIDEDNLGYTFAEGQGFFGAMYGVSGNSLLIQNNDGSFQADSNISFEPMPTYSPTTHTFWGEVEIVVNGQVIGTMALQSPTPPYIAPENAISFTTTDLQLGQLGSGTEVTFNYKFGYTFNDGSGNYASATNYVQTLFVP